MENSNGNLIVKLIHLLESNRDGLILIDGKWGTGKTFFVKNCLPRFYKLKVFYYISLLGVKSLSDFKAKIIDSYYLQDVNTLKSGLDSISGLGSISSGSPASANVLNGVFSSIGSSVRENILSKLEGVFILDDIERLNTSSLANEILTYCHSLYSASTNSILDFIVVSNTSSESHLALEHKEKIISDSVHYNPSAHDILGMGIIEDRLQELPHEDRMIFEEIASYNNIVNIRILMRCLNIALPLYTHAKNHQELAWEIPSRTILSSIFSYFILLFIYNNPIEKLIIESILHIPSLNSSNDENPHEARLLSALHNYKIDIVIKHYYSGNVSLNDILDKVFYEPKPLNIVDVALAPRPEFHEENEKDLYPTIIDLITRTIPCDLQQWLRAIQNYEYLTYHKYIPKSSSITLQFMTSKSFEFNNDDIVTYFEFHNNNPARSWTSGFDDGKLLFSILSIRYDNILKQKNLSEIKEKIEVGGWALFDVDLLFKLDPVGNYKTLEVLGAPFITMCILIKWSVKDIEQFNAFLRRNYRISNIAQFATNEKQRLIYLNHKLDIYCIGKREGFKYGAIYDLNNTVKHAISCL